jgi:tRNA pseudouridine55 synthase
MFSAKKIDGQRLYDLARKGQTVERKAVTITIKEYDILAYENDLLTVRIVCSKGTYIRSLAHDLGELLGCGALCQDLERTMVGEYKLSDSLDLKTVVKSIDMGF